MQNHPFLDNDEQHKRFVLPGGTIVFVWGVLLIVGGVFLYRYFTCGIRVSKDFEIQNMAVEPLANTINPNTESWASMARLPGIGPTRARAIVAYRDAFYQNHASDRCPFVTPDDLINVKGIGPATVERIREYLRCEENDE